jgi:very-short-patch-repair endonuclease
MAFIPRDHTRARELRKSSTAHEKTLWRQLRNSALAGHKFRRQHPVGPYFLDFACVEQRLAVELDGAGHVTDRAYDAARDHWLQAHGWRVLRFTNDQLVFGLRLVLETIDAALRR